MQKSLIFVGFKGIFEKTYMEDNNDFLFDFLTPRCSQDGPRSAQSSPKTAQDCLLTVSRRPKWAPRSLRDGLRGSPERAAGACTGTDLKLYLLPRLHSLCPQLELERILNSTSYFYSPVHILTLLSGISLRCEGTVARFAEGRWICFRKNAMPFKNRQPKKNTNKKKNNK